MEDQGQQADCDENRPAGPKNQTSKNEEAGDKIQLVKNRPRISGFDIGAPLEKAFDQIADNRAGAGQQPESQPIAGIIKKRQLPEKCHGIKPVLERGDYNPADNAADKPAPGFIGAEDWPAAQVFAAVNRFGQKFQ